MRQYVRWSSLSLALSTLLAARALADPLTVSPDLCREKPTRSAGAS